MPLGSNELSLRDNIIREVRQLLSGATVGTADTVARAGVDKLNDFIIDARDYGTLSASTGAASANVATLQAAATAAGALRADVVVPGMSIPINGEVVFPAYAGLVGAGRGFTTFLATHADARLTFDEPSETVIADWTFDGDHTASHAVQVKGATNALAMRNVRVTAATRGISFHNTQNSVIDKLVVDDCDEHLGILDGCGSLVFNALGVANFTPDATTYGIWMGHEGVEASGYTQPTAITFIAPMIECLVASDTGDAVIKIEGSNRSIFINGNFVNGDTAPIFDLAVSSPGEEATIQLVNSSIQGSETNTKAFRLSGGNTGIESIGRNIITGALTGFDVIGSGPRIYGSPVVMNNVGTEFAYSGGASWHGNLVGPAYGGMTNIITPDGWVPAFRMGEAAGSGAFCTFLFGDGRIGFALHAFSPDVTLQRGGADLMTMADGDSFRTQGTWDGGTFRLGDYRLWVDSTGDLRIKNGAPSSDTDGTVVGTQL